jgi:hypothetical protein
VPSSQWDKDLFDDPPQSMPIGSPTAAKAPKQKLSKTEQIAKKQSDTRSRSARIGVATKQRRNWEASPVGQARTKNIVDLNADHMEAQESSRNEMFKGGAASQLSHTDYRSLTPASIYHSLGVTNSGHGYGEQQLPGFESKHAAPTPPRWEDVPEQKQKLTEENARQFGTSLEQMKNDFGAQLDQSVWRAHMSGHHDSSTGEPIPFTKHFYGDHPSTAPEPLDRPQEMMRESREHLHTKGIEADPAVHTAAVSLVSPNTKFTAGERGNRGSPNIEAAESVFEQHDQGHSWQDVSSGKNRLGVRNQARPANSRRAARMIEHVEGGGVVGGARNAPSASNPQGSSMWGPKTGPFVNTFDTQHPDFLVGDVHTAGGGMYPHLSTAKPFKKNTDGSNVRATAYRNDPRSDDELKKDGPGVFVRDKSEREKAMEGTGSSLNGSKGKVTAHAMWDKAARAAIEERGLGTSVRQPQASQWGEEQIQRGEVNPKLDVPSHEEAYPQQNRHLINENQMRLFS